MIVNEKTKMVIPDSTILYLEASAGYTVIHRIGCTKPTLTVARTLAKLQHRVGAGFVRVSRTHLVNLTYVESFTDNSVTINGITLSISRRYQRLVNLKNYESKAHQNRANS